MLEDIAAEQKEKDRLAEEKVNQFLKSVGDSQKKAEQDDIQGMYQRGLSALSNKNYQSAYDSLYAAAEAGHVKAMTTLGKLMFDPTFVWKTKKNPMQKGAVDLLRLAYEKGDQEAGQQLREISGAAYEVKRQEKEAAERKAEAKAKAERMREKRRAENDAHRAKMAEEQAKRAEASRAAREREERAAAERLSAQRIADLNKNTWGG
jgi:outer membrane usher protein FimD/PapC